MEQRPNQNEQAHAPGELQRLKQEETARQIRQDIREAAYDGRAIANVTAKRIAEHIQPGSGPLYDFAMTGAVADDIYSELDVAREVVPELFGWVASLEDYCLGRLYQDAVPGWQDVTTEVTDQERIYYGITEALHKGQAIDHATVRVIASQLHGGKASALYALASCGAVVDGLNLELDWWRSADTPAEVEPWLDALDEYLDMREDNPGAIEGWHTFWPEMG